MIWRCRFLKEEIGRFCRTMVLHGSSDSTKDWKSLERRSKVICGQIIRPSTRPSRRTTPNTRKLYACGRVSTLEILVPLVPSAKSQQATSRQIARSSLLSLSPHPNARSIIGDLFDSCARKQAASQGCGVHQGKFSKS